MSATDPHTKDPTVSHSSGHHGHEMSDFSWSTVMWLIPLSAIVLVVFTIGTMYWFKGIKDDELAQKQTTGGDARQLQILRTKEAEVLGSYKWLDKTGGRAQIPLERAMELIVEENQANPGADYRPITDIYLQGAAFAAPQGQSHRAAEGAGQPAHAPAEGHSDQPAAPASHGKH